MIISKIDHVAITTERLDLFIAFYERVLGAQVEHEYELGGRRSVVQLRVGQAMLNVHRTGHGHPLVAARPTPGAIDICFRWCAPIADALALLERNGVEVIEGPVKRTCCDSIEGLSVYFRDPDDNLIELLSVEGEPWIST
jgi:catechol 2,3-dioxygenase-like lactoylglutathione lyase family enzyme